MSISTRISWALAALLLVSAPAGAQLGPGLGGGLSGLGSGTNRPGYRGAAPVNFHFGLGVMGVYDTGFLAAFLRPGGINETLNLYGAQAFAVASGSHSWRHSLLGLEYRGEFRRYSERVFQTGNDHALALQYNTQLGPRWSFSLQQNAGSATRGFGSIATPVVIDQPGIPAQELFNNRFYWAQSVGAAEYRFSPRLSAQMVGGGFTVRRKPASLVGTYGGIASGSLSYLLDARQSVGLNYTFSNFIYTGITADSVLHGLLATYKRRITRRLSAHLGGGAYSLESLATTAVVLDPEVAAILGTDRGLRLQHRLNVISAFEAGVDYAKNRQAFRISVRRGVLPGNGLILAAVQEAGTVGYDYTASRRLSFYLQGQYMKLTSQLQDLNSKTLQAGGGMSYSLRRNWSLTATALWRSFSIGPIRGQNGTRATLGIAYNSADYPLSFW